MLWRVASCICPCQKIQVYLTPNLYFCIKHVEKCVSSHAAVSLSVMCYIMHYVHSGVTVFISTLTEMGTMQELSM